MGRSIAICLGFVGGALITTAARSAPMDDRARICINRPGENGSRNVAPVTVRMAGAELTLLGEQEVCLRTLDEAAQTIALRFRYPYYARDDTPRYWETAPVSILVKKGQTTYLTLCPRAQNVNDPQWSKTGWHEMWVLSPPQSRKACGPLYDR